MRCYNLWKQIQSSIPPKLYECPGIYGRGGRSPFFQQHNSCPHIGRRFMDRFAETNLNLLPQPPRSPDLSPVEYVGDIKERRLRNSLHVPQSPQHELQIFQDTVQEATNLFFFMFNLFFFFENLIKEINRETFLSSLVPYSFSWCSQRFLCHRVWKKQHALKVTFVLSVHSGIYDL